MVKVKSLLNRIFQRGKRKKVVSKTIYQSFTKRIQKLRYRFDALPPSSKNNVRAMISHWRTMNWSQKFGN